MGLPRNFSKHAVVKTRSNQRTAINIKDLFRPSFCKISNSKEILLFALSASVACQSAELTYLLVHTYLKDQKRTRPFCKVKDGTFYEEKEALHW